MASSFKKGKVKLDLLTDIDMLFMVKKRYQGRNMSRYLSICSKGKNERIRNCDKIKNHHILNIAMQIICMDG